MQAIYVRVSTEEQARSGYSLADQLDSCRQRLFAQGLTDIAEYIDNGYSGEYLERPALEELRQHIRQGSIQNICIYDPDRLSRNLTNQLILSDEMDRAGVKLLFVTGDFDASPEGRLFFSLRGAISAYEKAKIRERTCRGRRAKAKAGKIVQNAHPYGYDWDTEHSMYIINEPEAAVVRLIYKLCIRNKLGTRSIARELWARGIPGRKPNKPLSSTCIDSILSRAMYYGEHFLFRQTVTRIGPKQKQTRALPQDQWISVQVPAIIDHATFLAAQKQRQVNRRLASRHTRLPYLLQGLIFCTVCSRRLTAYGRPKSGSDRAQSYRYYRCITGISSTYNSTQAVCGQSSIPADPLEQTIWTIITNKFKNLPLSLTGLNLSFRQKRAILIKLGITIGLKQEQQQVLFYIQWENPG